MVIHEPHRYTYHMVRRLIPEALETGVPILEAHYYGMRILEAYPYVQYIETSNTGVLILEAR